jgi:hypothetical protein
MTHRQFRRVRPFIVVVLAGVLLAAAPGSAEPKLVEQAIAALDNSDHDRWAYTMTKREHGKTTVARHDPSLPQGERWVLVSVDGGPPAEKDQAEFRQWLGEANPDEADQDSDQEEIRAMITPGTLELAEETPDRVVYRFEPAAEDEEDAEFYKHVDATLCIARNGSRPYVESVALVSREPFSPAFGIKVKEFSTVLSYAPVGSAGTVLPSRVEMRMAGRAMLVKKIQETVDVRFQDYRYVGD